MKANESKAERLLRGKDAALDDKDMEVLLDAFYEDSDERHDEVAVAQRRGFRDGYRLGMIAGTEQLILRIAADKLNKARPILAGALKSYAGELCKFDGGQDNG